MEKYNKILIDTNFLLTMIRYKIHAIEEIKQKTNAEIYTLSGVIEEMQGLSKENKKIKNEVTLAKQIIEKNDIIVIESKMENVDNEMIEKSNEFIIATNDKELRQKIRKTGGKSIFIKKLAFVELEEITN